MEKTITTAQKTKIDLGESDDIQVSHSQGFGWVRFRGAGNGDEFTFLMSRRQLEYLRDLLIDEL